MFSLFDRLFAAPATSTGQRIYAVGDAHGRFDLFKKLLNQIKEDVDARDRCSSRIVLLGDVIDRGPQSRQLLGCLQRIQRSTDRLILLRGNHEEMLLASANGSGPAQRLWLANGGEATLRSYGLKAASVMSESPQARGKIITDAVGQETLVWLEALPLTYRCGDYFFCHAGVRPGVPLQKQKREDLLWIRNEFLHSNRSHGAIIVHGHTETETVGLARNRINVDTAAYRTGVLTAVALQGSARWFIQTGRSFLRRSDIEQGPHRSVVVDAE